MQKNRNAIFLTLGALAVIAIAGFLMTPRTPKLSAAELQPEAVAERLNKTMQNIKARKFVDARNLILPLAASGDSRAQYILGGIYDQDSGIALTSGGKGQLGTMQENFDEAETWYTKSAEQQNLKAMTALGNHYCWGVGGARMGGVDSAKGTAYLLEAANKGSSAAMMRLAANYEQGVCAKIDNAAALKWHMAAAAQGDMISRHNLGLMHSEGRGTPADPVQAYVWFQLAGSDEDGSMRARLSSEEKAEADRRIALLKQSFSKAAP